MRLRIGRMAYANLFPIFYTLQSEVDCSHYEFIDGVPSDLNLRIRSGNIDISPSSSIEYLRHSDKYLLINGHSISSFGPVGSIFLFSRRPLESLGGHTILTSSQSETSVALLEIIMKKFFSLDCIFRPAAELPDSAIAADDAYLLIGDTAMTEARRRPDLLVYDLGDLWYRYTGLPSVFALWIARREAADALPDLFKRFSKDLDYSMHKALENLGAISEQSPLADVIPPAELVTYWKGISYGFGDAHKKGLELFRRYAEELGLLNPVTG